MLGEEIIKKGYTINLTYEIQFPIESTGMADAYRVKDLDGNIRRLELFKLVDLTPDFVDSDSNPLFLKHLSKFNYKSMI